MTSTADANRRWPDYLAGACAPRSRPAGSAPLQRRQPGIGGNRVLADGPWPSPENQRASAASDGTCSTARTSRSWSSTSASTTSSARRAPPTRRRSSTGLRDLVRQAHARGIKVVGATLMPVRQAHRVVPEAREDVRQTDQRADPLGQGLRRGRRLRQGAAGPVRPPCGCRPTYDSGDHLHPSDEGYGRMADAFDLEYLKGSARRHGCSRGAALQGRWPPHRPLSPHPVGAGRASGRGVPRSSADATSRPSSRTDSFSSRTASRRSSRCCRRSSLSRCRSALRQLPLDPDPAPEREPGHDHPRRARLPRHTRPRAGRSRP